ncbi:oligosaccharide flippase family protein [Flavihumibacter rivuli]|uniref:lipopolysaccharide biosynthesis protein n=1 Tax=Flavihumibacter rivuli TaxID=2838156 RepID=UPI001BDEE77F|nr:oligosaccharide flippase family protein [Flavihumibacter rivuli]ULQ57952.1 oligosaccharide flippase family protein [Flavihumibacter rivuli]
MKSLSLYVKDFFSKGHERSVLVKKNIFYSLLIKGVSVLVGFVLVPMTIHYVNKTQYGIWLTVSSIIGWFSFFDIGLGNGLRNKLATALALGEKEKARSYVSTTYALLCIVSLTAMVLFLLVNPFINWNRILNISINDLSGLNDIVLWVFVFFCFQFVFQLITVVFTASQQSAKSSLILLAGQLLSMLVIYLLTLYTKGSLLYLVLVLAGVPPLVQMLFSIYYYKGQFNSIAPSFKAVDFSHARELLGLGGYFFIIQIGVIVLYQTSNIIITQLFGPEQVTTYNIAYKLFSVVTILLTIAINPFWSAFTDAYAKNDFNWIRLTLYKIRKFWVLITVGALFILLVSPYVYQFWVGKYVTVPFSLSVVMFFYVIGNAWVAAHCFLLNGVGKIRLQLVMYVICILVNIPVSVYFGKMLGLTGVVIGNVVMQLIMGVVFFLQTEKIIHQKAKGIWNK